VCVFLGIFAAIGVLRADMLGDPEHTFIPANPLQTPADIVSEWSFLPYDALLR